MGQSYMRFILAKRTYADAIRRRDALDCIQTNIRAFQYLKEWEWMKIIFKIKPLISQAEEGKKMEELEKNYNTVKAALEKEKKRRIELEEQAGALEQEKNEMMQKMEAQNALLEDAEGRCEEMIAAKIDLDTRIRDLQEKLEDE